MLKQLTEAEKELNKKQQTADQDMMMAGMVSNYVFKKTIWLFKILIHYRDHNLLFSIFLTR